MLGYSVRRSPIWARSRAVAIAGVLLGGALALVAVPPTAQAARLAATKCPSTPYINGFDISQSQGSVTWSAVTCEDFVYAYATDGTSFVDPSFSADRAGALAAGLPFGAIDFFEPDESATEQATAFLSVYSPRPGDLPPVLDVEVTDDQTAATILAGIGTWVSGVEAATGLVPVIYTYPDFWSSTLGNPSTFTADPLWIADLSGPPVVPASNWGGNGWTLWQYSFTGTVSGVSVQTDLDYFAGASLTGFASSASSTVTISSHTSNPVVGQPITVDVQVAGHFTGTDVPAPSGTVSVSDGTQSCEAPLSGSGGVATGSCAITEDASRTYSFTASYPGDSNWDPSATAGGTPVTVGAATSKTTLKLSVSKVTYGDEHVEHLSVTVSPEFAGSTPTGTIRVKESKASLCVITLSSGKGSCRLSAKQLAVGTHQLVASYGGSTDFGASKSGRRTLTVVS